MKLSRFKTVRGRLIGLVVLIVVPMAILSALAAATTYHTVLQSIEGAQIETAANYAVRARIWYRGALRTLLATIASVQAADASAVQCDAIGRRVLDGIDGYQGVRIRFSGGLDCAASRNDELTASQLDGILDQVGARPFVRVWGGQALADARYDYVDVGGRRQLVVYARRGEIGAPGGWAALFVLDAASLDISFAIGASDPGAVIGLVGRNGEVVVARGADESDNSWLPAVERVPGETVTRWRSESRSGGGRSYAGQLVVAPDLYLLASFDDVALNAARTQFYALLVIPLATLVLLCLVYIRGSHVHVVRWLRGIERAARQDRTGAGRALAPVSDEMPSDIRRVAEAFNDFVESKEARQQALQASLDQNRFLVRELNHRVKNSLQVVQSYLALSRREHSAEAREALIDAECRVHVLSAAYRFALADGEMQPVRVDALLEEVIGTVSHLVRGRDQWITGRIETQKSLPLDRSIPLGLLVVELLARSLRATPGVQLTVVAVDVDEHSFEMSLIADRDLTVPARPKLIDGLVAQIEARPLAPAAGRKLGSWTVAA